MNVHSRSAGHHAVRALQEAQCTRAVLHAWDGKAHYAEVRRELHRGLLIWEMDTSNTAF